MFKRTLSLGIATAILAGCESLSPAGLIAAARLDPVETPPSDIAVAVSVPDALRLRDGDAKLSLSFVPEDLAAGAPVMATVPLMISQGGTGPRAANADEAIYVLAFGAQAEAQIADVQDQIRALKAQDVAGTGSLSIAVSGGCLVRPLGNTLPVATWLRTDPDGAFVPLLTGLDMFEELSPADRAQLYEGFKPC